MPMTKHDRGRVAAALAVMVRKYPNAKWGTDNVDAYVDELKNQSVEAVLWAIPEAASVSATFVPPAPLIRKLAAEKAVELRARSAQRTFDEMQQGLPSEIPDREAALEKFYSLCDEAKARIHDDEITAENRHLLYNLLAKLGPVYGHPEATAMDYARALIASFGPGDQKKGRLGENFSPDQVIDVLRDAPGLFAKYPTEGMLRAAIRGHHLDDYPADWVRDGNRDLVLNTVQVDPEHPAEAFARRCEDESRRRRISPGADTPMDLGAERAREMQRLMDMVGRSMAMPDVKPRTDVERAPDLTGPMREPGDDDVPQSWHEHEGKPIAESTAPSNEIEDLEECPI